jgi:Zn-dependent protease with chaperone function
MDNAKRLTWDTLRISGLAVIALFLIPALTFALSTQILSQWDQTFSRNVMQKATAEQRPAAEAFVQRAKPSVICNTTDPELAKVRYDMCNQLSNVWQVNMARSVAVIALIGSGVMIALVLALSLAAFGNRSVQYFSFVTGKQLMVWGSVAQVLAQGAMMVWLSYWVTAFYFNVYIVKLIGIAAVLVALAALAAIFGIFSRNPSVNAQDGEHIREADAPRLWARISQMAERLKTAPPKQIIAGIDANFFVTEAPLTVGNEVLTGRTLYVSLPLLRKLETSEADAVLAHELAHLSGGDTANSAKLGPALQHYDQYCAAMGSGGATIVVWPILALYRIMFELAFARSRREREFRADKVAAKLVSPQAISKSLIKVAAYAIYRNKIERDLFEHLSLHTGALGIATAIDSGLPAYVQSPAFMENISSVHVPHPFDSHPPLSERMQAVGAAMDAQDYATVAVEPPATSWVSEISTADAIESRMWSTFDQAFAAEHERVLAFRYLPANDAEQAVVLKYFPTREFTLKKGATIELSYAGIRSSSGDQIHWGTVTDLNYKDGNFLADTLAVSVNEHGKKRTATIKLPQIGTSKAEFQGVLALYFRRHQIMSQLQRTA